MMKAWTRNQFSTAENALKLTYGNVKLKIFLGVIPPDRHSEGGEDAEERVGWDGRGLQGEEGWEGMRGEGRSFSVVQTPLRQNTGYGPAKKPVWGTIMSRFLNLGLET